MKRAPKWILLGGCLILCALNLSAAFMRLHKGVQHVVDSTSVSVYPVTAGMKDQAVAVRDIEGKGNSRVIVLVRNSYDDDLIRSVAVPNLWVLGATMTLFLVAELTLSSRKEPNLPLKPTPTSVTPPAAPESRRL